MVLLKKSAPQSKCITAQSLKLVNDTEGAGIRQKTLSQNETGAAPKKGSAPETPFSPRIS